MLGSPAETKLDWDDSDNLIYIGKHEELGAGENQPSWKITKFTWNSSDNLVNIANKIGRWNQRETLF